jgi:hypothetical protein
MAILPAGYPIDILPSILDVAALLRARTKDVNGVEVGTFNDDTRPTSSQVLTLINEAVIDIQAQLGPWLPVELADAARSAAALRTACLIELSHFPEQVQSNRSAYPEYVQLLAIKIAALQQAAKPLATSTRIEVPWVDFIPDLAVPVEVVVPAEAA